ncbi:MAG TPA: sigma-70 family RNA polymerase sigma factor [Thermoanaerobaculia bacterium]|nr:sigma-70 family RNA polymerase sigma factor [Thermoanaerobaculia bacterium]
MAVEHAVTDLLIAIREGDSTATSRLMTLVYDELHAMARRQLRRSRPGQTLNTTALVHEAYLKLVQPARADWNDRSHFLAIAATAMRYIVVDHARRRSAQKRGGDAHHTSLDASELGIEGRVVETLALDQAIERLAAVSDRLARLVELLFFGGLTEEEAAGVLGLSERTVRRDWRKARAFLSRVLDEQPGGC